MSQFTYLAIITTCISVSWAIPFTETDGVCGDIHPSLVSVDITGCASDGDCIIDRNTTQTLTIKYKANQNTNKTEFHLVEWVYCPLGVCSADIGAYLPDFDYNGCHFQSCPVKAGEIQTLKTVVKLPKHDKGVTNIQIWIRPENVMHGDLVCGNIKLNVDQVY